jgi:hypothetical protein
MECYKKCLEGEVTKREWTAKKMEHHDFRMTVSRGREGGENCD